MREKERERQKGGIVKYIYILDVLKGGASLISNFFLSCRVTNRDIESSLISDPFISICFIINEKRDDEYVCLSLPIKRDSLKKESNV